jgi:hypothetical protein
MWLNNYLSISESFPQLHTQCSLLLTDTTPTPTTKNVMADGRQWIKYWHAMLPPRTFLLRNSRVMNRPNVRKKLGSKETWSSIHGRGESEGIVCENDGERFNKIRSLVLHHTLTHKTSVVSGQISWPPKLRIVPSIFKPLIWELY